MLCIGGLAIFTAGLVTGKRLQQGTEYGALIALGQEQARMWALVAQQDTTWQAWEARLRQRRPMRQVPK